MLWEVFICIVTSASPHLCRDAKPDANALANRLPCGRLRGCGVEPISVGLLRLSAAGVLSSRKVCDGVRNKRCWQVLQWQPCFGELSLTLRCKLDLKR